jgi:flagellar biogenesis protein FliO
MKTNIVTRHCVTLPHLYVSVTPGQHKVYPLVFDNFHQFPSCQSVTSLGLVAGLAILWIYVVRRFYRKRLHMGSIYTSIYMVITRRTRGDTRSLVRHLSFFPRT